MNATVKHDPVLGNATHLQSLCYRLYRAEMKRQTISADELASVLREARHVVESIAELIHRTAPISYGED